MVSVRSAQRQTPGGPFSDGGRRLPAETSASRASFHHATGRLTAVFWIGGMLLASIQAWAAIRAQSMNADGVAYLDIADAYLAGDWKSAINAVWSPLYSWILAVSLGIAGPAVAESVVVHLTNLGIFALAFLAYGFLHRELRKEFLKRVSGKSRGVPIWAWDAVGYLLFLYAALALVTIWAVTPDLLMAAFVCLAAGLIVRIRSGSPRTAEVVLLGVALGAAYLTKSVMFPVGLLFLASTLLALRGTRSGARAVALSAVIFLVVSVPWIATISRDQGRFTFGEAGRLTYLRYVNGIPYPYWNGETPGLGMPVHPPRLVLQEPPVYEFASPVTGTYPLSFDPAYWYEGARMRFRPDQQAQAVLRGALFYYDLFLRDLGVPLACILLLLMISVNGRAIKWPELGRWTLLMPAAAALILYGLVYVESRYAGVFVLLIFLDAIANLRIPAAAPRRLVTTAFALIIAFFATNLTAFYLRGSLALSANRVATSGIATAPASPSAVATSLRQLGIQRGEPVAVIGYGFDSFWARAARVRLVAELPEKDAGALWSGDAALEDAVLDAFAAAGARAIVVENAPPYAAMAGWQRIERSSSYLRSLDSSFSR